MGRVAVQCRGGGPPPGGTGLAYSNRVTAEAAADGWPSRAAAAGREPSRFGACACAVPRGWRELMPAPAGLRECAYALSGCVRGCGCHLL